jgi:hypothetical protein
MLCRDHGPQAADEVVGPGQVIHARQEVRHEHEGDQARDGQDGAIQHGDARQAVVVLVRHTVTVAEPSVG